MLNAFYDLINHPERYRAIWRDGELYVEPVAHEDCATHDTGLQTLAEKVDDVHHERAVVSLHDKPEELPRNAA